MLTTEANERLARVGPGTPGGELMRRYWIPIAPYAQLLEEDVIKVRVLGEDLVLYKDLQGRMGLIGDTCLHRCANLRWGIPDDEGLRCPYHGWLYSAEGQVLDTPLEAADSTFKDRLSIQSYPVRELGGLVFTYMGPKPLPALPPWDLFVWPNAIRQIGITILDCNWLQCQENTGDPLHSVWLHGHMFKYVLEKMGELEKRAGNPKHTIYGRIKTGAGVKDLYAEATEYGMEKGVVYSKELGADEDRVDRHSTVIFPFYTQNGVPGGPRSEFQIRVPIDDTHTYHISYQCYAAPPEIQASTQDIIPWYEIPTRDENDRPILDFVMAQDAIAWTSQGPLTDRSKEHLGRTDIPIIFLRKQLDEEIAKVERGEAPMNFFLSSEDTGQILYGSGAPPESNIPADWKRADSRGAFRASYHKGFSQDDADRYGPAIPLVVELHREIEEMQTRAAARTAADAGELS